MNPIQYSKNPAILFETCRDLDQGNGCLPETHTHIHYCIKPTQPEEQTTTDYKKGLITTRYVQNKATQNKVVGIHYENCQIEIKEGSVDVSNGVTINCRVITIDGIQPIRKKVFVQEVISSVLNYVHKIPGINVSEDALVDGYVRFIGVDNL